MTIQNYRRLAAEAREVAKSVSGQDIKEALEQVAEANDELARKLERGEPFAWWKTRRPIPNPS